MAVGTAALLDLSTPGINKETHENIPEHSRPLRRGSRRPACPTNFAAVPDPEHPVSYLSRDIHNLAIPLYVNTVSRGGTAVYFLTLENLTISRGCLNGTVVDLTELTGEIPNKS